MAKEKQISIRFLPEQIGEETVNRILTWWRNEVPIRTIIRKINPGRPADLTITFVDVYAVVSHAQKYNKATQRREPRNELTITQFQKLFRLWRNGLKADMIKTELDCPKKNYQIETIIKALNRRYKEEKSQPNTESEITRNIIATFDHIIAYAQRVTVDGNPCLLLKYENLPPKFQSLFDKEYPDLGIRLKTEKSTGEPEPEPEPKKKDIDPEEVDVPELVPVTPQERIRTSLTKEKENDPKTKFSKSERSKDANRNFFDSD